MDNGGQLYLSKAHRLSYFEEAIGSLHGLTEQDGAVIALIAKLHLALPAELEQNLRPLIGQRISIIHTDIPDKQYLYRVFTHDGEESKK